MQIAGHQSIVLRSSVSTLSNACMWLISEQLISDNSQQALEALPARSVQPSHLQRGTTFKSLAPHSRCLSGQQPQHAYHLQQPVAAVVVCSKSPGVSRPAVLGDCSLKLSSRCCSDRERSAYCRRDSLFARAHDSESPGMKQGLCEAVKPREACCGNPHVLITLGTCC